MPHKPIDLRQYLRRPDRDFWLDLLRAPPGPTQEAGVRRQRVARASLGLATVISGLYSTASAILVWHDAMPVIVANFICVLVFGTGMWMASLGKHRVARGILMICLSTQIGVLLWFTGDTLGIGVYAIVTAALSAALYGEDERPARIFFFAVSATLLLASMTLATTPRITFDSIPAGILLLTRLTNTLFALYMVFLLIALFDREVLRSEHALTDARARSDRLLNSVLPEKIAEQLRISDRMIANRHPEVTVMFADIAGFTPWSAQQDPETVVALLEKIFSRFDALVAAAGAEKIKTIGDAYMVVSGAPDARRDHAHVIAGLALGMLDETRQVHEETGIPLDLRVGIHTGPVIAGVIGALRFSYDVWGDTVNTASRMESHGEPGRIQVSSETRARLVEDFRFEPRGPVNIKGKGEMPTWWLLGRA